MKKTIVILLIFTVLCVGYIWANQINVLDANLRNSQSADEKVLVVEEFWQAALSQDNFEKYITPTPAEFYDESSRCSAVNNSEDDKDVVLKPKTREDRFTRNLKKTAHEIREEKLTMVNAKVFRSWENEAIIDVSFSRQDNVNIKEKKFFFAIRIDGNWKIFLTTSVPDLLNEEFAKHDCPQ